MRKYIAFILVLSLVGGLFSGCTEKGNTVLQPADTVTNNTPTDNRSETAGPATMESAYGLTQGVFQSIYSGVLLMVGEHTGFVRGERVSLEMAPEEIGEEVYIPGAFTTIGLGGEAVYDETANSWYLKLGEAEVTLTEDAPMAAAGSNSDAQRTPAVLSPDECLMSLTDYSTALSVGGVKSGELLILGDAAAEALEELPDASEDFMHLVMEEAFYQPDPDWPVDRSDFDRHAISKIMSIDPEHIPYRSQPDYLVANCHSMYIEDFSMYNHSSKSDYFTCEMTIYNHLNTTYGAVEVYDKDDNLLEWVPVDPSPMMDLSVTGPFRDAATMINGAYNAITSGDINYFSGYKDGMDNTKVQVTIDVPKDGYIFITDNPDYSKAVAACNFAMVYKEIFNAIINATGAIVDAGGLTKIDSSTKELIAASITNSISNGLKGDTTALDVFADAYVALKEKITTVDLLNGDQGILEIVEFVLDLITKGPMQTTMTNMYENTLNAMKENAAEGGDDIDFVLSSVISACPVTAYGANLGNLIFDLCNFVCMVMDIKDSVKTTPLLIEATNWRKAYADYLKDSEFYNSNYHFELCYITDDTIPELVLIKGDAAYNDAYILTCNSGKVYRHPESFNASYGGFGYLEYLDVYCANTWNHGYTGKDYRSFFGTSQYKTESFSHNEDAHDEETEYYYNQRKVSKWYFDKKLAEAEERFDNSLIVVSYYDAHIVNDADIETYIMNYQK